MLSLCPQSRSLGIRMRLGPSAPSSPAEEGGGAGSANSMHVHLVNATLTATQRTLCSLLENHQTPEGITVSKG